MGLYGYNCYNFSHDNSFGGSVFISGTTCDGVVAAYTLTLGQSVCMDIDFPFISCGNPIFSGECVPSTPTPTPTQTSTPTPTLTPSPTPCICFPAGTGFTNTQGGVLTIEKDSLLNRIYVGGGFSSYDGGSARIFTAIDATSSNLINGFTGNTFDNTVIDIKVQPDGKILAGGIFTTYKGVDCPDRLARINTDGSIDTAFSTGLGTGFTGSVSNIYIQPDGKIMVGGLMTQIQGTTIGYICRLNSDGTLDTTFSAATPGFSATTSGAYAGVQEIISDGGTGYYVSGNFNTFNGNPCDDVLRLNSDGSLNNTFSVPALSGTTTRIISIDIQPSTGFLIIGNYPGGVGAVNTSGTLQWTNNAAGMAEVNYVEVLNDNKIIVGGRSLSRGVMRINANGTTDGTFIEPTMISVSQPSRGVMDIITDPDCYIIGGSWISIDGYIGTSIVRLYNDGTLDQCNPIPVSPTPSNTPTITPSTTIGTTPTPTPSVSPTNTITPTISVTPTNTATPSLTPTQTITPTCGTFTTQYMRSEQQGNKDIRFTLFDNPDFTGNANAVCDYTITGTFDIDGGAINQPYTTIMAQNDHSHTYDTGSNITGFTISSVVPVCPCVLVIFNQITPTPTLTPTNTPTISVTPSITPSITPTITPTNTNTPEVSPTTTTTPTITPTNTNTPSVTSVCQQIFLYPANSTACAHLGTLTLFDTDNSITPTRLYLANECGVTPVTGGNQWYSQGAGANSYQVDNGGFIINTTLCP